MKIFLILLISINIYANNILDNYFENGIDSVQKQLDYELTNKNYWDKYLEDKDLTFGYVSGYSSILTCDKESSKLNLYENRSSQKFKLKNGYDAYTGKVQGDKLKEGDLKTPLGVYQLTQKIEKLDPFYGPLAFVTSYPNIYDKYKGKNGSGIWIHGVPEDQEREKYTKGCIAIENDNIRCLSNDIDFEKTLLIINPDKNFKSVKKDDMALLLSNLFKWRYAWKYDDIDIYLSYYSDDFIKSNGMKIESFKTYKTRVFKKVEDKKIIFKDINIISYPNLVDTYQITFKEIYKSNSVEFIGDKTLMVKLKGNYMKIFTED
ncbi:MAG: L,D-transpeptidase family protein [Campylobacterales bacterium]|nr:L,D-transpeptidase family protein [Campylobacterales bacterium]